MTAITYPSAVADRGFVEFQLTPACHLETLPVHVRLTPRAMHNLFYQYELYLRFNDIDTFSDADLHILTLKIGEALREVWREVSLRHPTRGPRQSTGRKPTWSILILKYGVWCYHSAEFWRRENQL